MSTALLSSTDTGFLLPEAADGDRITSACVDTASDAVGSMLDCEAEVVRIPVPSVCFNRRTVCPDGTVETNFRYPTAGDYSFQPVDDELTAIRLRSASGTGGIIANYGCHPVTGGYDREADYYRISSDYVHYFRNVAEAAWRYPVLFTLGAAGDVVPRDRYGMSRKRIGSVLGESMVLADRMFTTIEGPLSVRRFTVPCETIVSFDAAEAKERYERAGNGDADESVFQKASFARFRSDLYPENRFDIPVRIIGIGGVTLVALPFEVLSEFALRQNTSIRKP